ncbi:MAG: APC family permease, partial [Caldilineaceae bacterium]
MLPSQRLLQSMSRTFMGIGGFRNVLFGRALRTKESPHQTISKTVGLAVFASDSLSSVAYAGGEILLILAILGTSSYWMAIPITVAISFLLIILTFSYRQTIFAYPSGGGAYIVARDNFGETAAQVAGAALLIDYILTVAVSIASGVDQIASAFPVLFEYKVQLALLLVLMITFVNLRGVKESGRVFAVPTYFFVFMMIVMIGYGLFSALTGNLGQVTNVPPLEIEPIPLTGFALAFLLLRAFSSGTTALTGVEAISNGITAFKPPKSKNAATTLVWDAGLLMIMFLGLGILGYLVAAQPSEKEVLISQVARTVYGDGLMRLLTLGSATVILIMAANTSFADFPRLAALQAGDGFLPKQFTFRGSRLVFSWGVILLAAFASLLLIVFQGSVSRLIPLYAIGVFLCFTISQAGMAKRWRRVGRLMRSGNLAPGQEIETMGSIIHHDTHWSWKMILNGTGAVITSIVMMIFLITKFTHGAWLIVLLIPILVWVFTRIHRHYKSVAVILSTAGQHASDERRPMQAIVLVGDVHRETLKLVEFAHSLGVPWKAVHIAVNEERVADIQKKWAERVGMGELVIVRSPFRSLTRPLRSYVEKLLRQQKGGYVQVIMGELRTGNPATQALHQNAHIIQRLALNDLPGVVATIVPFQLETYRDGFENGP